MNKETIKDKDRQLIRKCLRTNINCDLEGDVSKVIEWLQELYKGYPDYPILEIDSDYESDYDGQRRVFSLYGRRLETDEEYVKRVNIEQKRIEEQKVKEAEQQKYAEYLAWKAEQELKEKQNDK